MYKLGEYDDALELTEILKARNVELDGNTASMLATQQKHTQQHVASYQKDNREGIEYYQQQEYEKAKASFALAQGFAPVNTGVSLNLLQCLLQIIKSNNKADLQMSNECKRLFKLIDDMELKEPYKEKYNNLREELARYLGY